MIPVEACRVEPVRGEINIDWQPAIRQTISTRVRITYELSSSFIVVQFINGLIRSGLSSEPISGI